MFRDKLPHTTIDKMLLNINTMETTKDIKALEVIHNATGLKLRSLLGKNKTNTKEQKHTLDFLTIKSQLLYAGNVMELRLKVNELHDDMLRLEFGETGNKPEHIERQELLETVTELETLMKKMKSMTKKLKL